MSRSGWANAAGLAAVLALATVLARTTHRTPMIAVASASRADVPARRVPLPEGGGFGLPDGTGRLVPLRPYHRIVSCSLTTDRLLVALCEPTRVLAFSAAGGRGPWGYQYAGKASVDGLGSLEKLIALKPDLLLMNTYEASGRVAKLRAAGIEVFDLGELRGVPSFVHTAESVGELVGHPERATDLVQGFRRRLDNVAARLGSQRRKTAVYVAIIGTNIYGGTVGTSYHDVLASAGLIDAAAKRFRDWPAYSSEQLVSLAPEVVVTKVGMGAAVCTYPGLDHLPACRGTGQILELPSGLIDEPGLAMLDAAERLFELAYPERGQLDKAPSPP